MSAGIELNDHMFSAREVPWHGLGTVLEEAPTAAAAIREAKLNWQVHLKPAFVHTDEGVMRSEGFFPMRRNRGEWAFIGNATRVVSERYEVLQNVDAFTFMDNLVDQGLAYETAGSLKNNSWVWMTAKLPESISIGGVDETDIYLLLSNSHDGTKAVRVDVTPVRVVCQNTLSMAWGSSRRSWSAKHLSTLEGQMQQARETLDLTFEYVDEFQAQAEMLLDEQFSMRRFENLIAKVVPESPRAETHKESLKTVFELSPTIAGTPIEGTAYGALNAVSEYFEHIVFANNDTRRSEQSQLLNTWEGNTRRMRDKAARELVAAL